MEKKKPILEMNTVVHVPSQSEDSITISALFENQNFQPGNLPIKRCQ